MTGTQIDREGNAVPGPLRTVEDWDERYRAASLVWSGEPNRWVRRHTEHLAPGTALDLASGEGRNALWLAERGWQVTAVDFSRVAMDKAERLAVGRSAGTRARFRGIVADLRTYRPSERYDLVLVVYHQVPVQERTAALRMAGNAVAPGGRLLVVAHHLDNLTKGVGGPQSADVLYTEHDVLDDLRVFPYLVIRTAERAEREVEGHDRPALDLVVELEHTG